jgi:hypothetical protein
MRRRSQSVQADADRTGLLRDLSQPSFDAFRQQAHMLQNREKIARLLRIFSSPRKRLGPAARAAAQHDPMLGDAIIEAAWTAAWRRRDSLRLWLRRKRESDLPLIDGDSGAPPPAGARGAVSPRAARRRWSRVNERQAARSLATWEAASTPRHSSLPSPRSSRIDRAPGGSSAWVSRIVTSCTT